MLVSANFPAVHLCRLRVDGFDHRVDQPVAGSSNGALASVRVFMFRGLVGDHFTRQPERLSVARPCPAGDEPHRGMAQRIESG